MTKRIPNLSVERFAAYLDNNLPIEEMAEIEHLVEADDNLQTLLDLNDAIDNNTLDNNFELPQEILDGSLVIPDVDAGIPDDFGLLFEEFNDFFQTKGDRFSGNDALYGKDGNGADDLLTQDSEPLENSKDMENSYRTIGESGENIYDPLFIKQPDGHSCGLKSQQIILRDYGIDIPFDDLEQIATEAGFYSENGTHTRDLGKVLEMADIGTHQIQRGTIYDLTNELAQGHRVLVSVDSHELWFNDSLKGKLTNWFDDVFHDQRGNHALIVAGIEVNPNNVNDVQVVLTDSGSGNLRIEYPLDQFMDAWKDSNCFMVATDVAAPFQFDSATGMEVPSNFASNYQYNQFVIENGYRLNPNMIKSPLVYQPAFKGHLNMIGNCTYEEYIAQHFPYDSIDIGFLGEDSESTGGVGSGMLGESAESCGSVGSGMLGEDAESCGSVGLGDWGDPAESTGSVGSGMLGEGAESCGSVGLGDWGDPAESTGSGGIDTLPDDDFDSFFSD